MTCSRYVGTLCSNVWRRKSNWDRDCIQGHEVHDEPPFIVRQGTLLGDQECLTCIRCRPADKDVLVHLLLDRPLQSVCSVRLHAHWTSVGNRGTRDGLDDVFDPFDRRETVSEEFAEFAS